MLLLAVDWKKYAFADCPNRSSVNVAPFTVPLFPFPLSSFALPLNGHQPARPSVGTYAGGVCALVVIRNPKSTAIVRSKHFDFMNNLCFVPLCPAVELVVKMKRGTVNNSVVRY